MSAVAVPTPPRSAGPNLVANFLPVRFRNDSFVAGTLPFTSNDELDSLREKWRATHAVRRHRDLVICAPLSADSEMVGERRTFAIKNHRDLTMSLVKATLMRELLAMGFKLTAFRQPTFIFRHPRYDLLAQCMGGRFDSFSEMHVYPEYKLDTRSSGLAGQPGVIVGLRTRNEIDLTVLDLMRRGLPVEGRYVLAETGEVSFNPDLDPRVYRRLAGMIDSVHEARLSLRDAPTLAEVKADRAWLEGRRETFSEVIALLSGGRHEEVLEALEEARFGLLGADGRLQRITALARRLAQSGPLTIASGISVDVGLPLGSPSSPARATRVTSRRIEEPTFVFDPGRDKTSRQAQKGLTLFGPFDSQFFTPRTPKIVVLTPQAYQGTVETFMDRFRRGVPGGKVFQQGFARKYRLADCSIIIRPFAAGPRDASAYRDACLAVADLQERPDLAIVITSKEQQDLQGDDSPYLVAKSTLMGQGIVVQEVQVDTIKRGNLDYPLDSMALQCYAKMGGIPFVIAAPHTIAHELVIGIGSAHVKQSRFATPERIVGITTVFNADGNYILSNTSREADYEHYPEELLRALRICIDEVKMRNAWQAEDSIRLIFHVFKPLKDTEAEAVKHLVEGMLSEFRAVEFAFLHVSEDHDWSLFDTGAPGTGNHRLPSGQSLPKGRGVPARGHTVILGKTEILLTVTGPFDIKTVTQALPRPLLLKLHPASTFVDIEYLAGQVFRFTGLSWRRFYPSSRPITILYSDLIASLLGRLRHVRNWNADVIPMHFRTRKWFL